MSVVSERIPSMRSWIALSVLVAIIASFWLRSGVPVSSQLVRAAVTITVVSGFLAFLLVARHQANKRTRLAMGVVVAAGLATLVLIAAESRRPFVTAFSAVAMIVIAGSVTAGAMLLAGRANLVRSRGTWSHAIW
jgi:peptidoglycan/LPS O-acetylase OafA/YrhL